MYRWLYMATACATPWRLHRSCCYGTDAACTPVKEQLMLQSCQARWALVSELGDNNGLESGGGSGVHFRLVGC